MTLAQFDALLVQADEYAAAGEWQRVFETLSQASTLQPGHAGTVTGLGTCLIQLNRLGEAVPYFERAAILAPTSPEAHNNLGVALALTCQPAAAEAAYRQALACDGEHAPAWKNLALLCLQQDRFAEGVTMLAALVKAHPQDVEALLMLAACYDQAGEAQSAQTLYRRVLELQPDHAEARAALARLTPGRVARPEHARKLSALKARKAGAPASKPWATAFYGPGEVSDGVRLGVPAQALAAQGSRTKVAPAPMGDDLQTHAVFVFSRPQLAPTLLDGLAACRRAGKRIVVDLDDDFHHLPPDHPGYAHVGPGNPRSLQALEAAIAQADLLTVATPVLAERYRRFARRVEVVPNGWSRSNPLWDKPAPRRNTLNIGWAGTVTHRPDVAFIKQDLIRFLRETPQALLVIGGDPAIYEAFSALPEARRLFLPMVPFDDYPFLLAHFDILLAPLRDNAFNQAKSDIKLLEAGIRRIPWVASPSPAYRAWGVGGLFAEKPGEWYTTLKRLADDAVLRRELGEAGRQKAETREAAAAAGVWRDLLIGLSPEN